MPTSKDILNAAKKVLDDNEIVPMAYKDTTDLMVQDIAAFSKARAELATGINSIKGQNEVLEGRLKKLAAGLTELQKNAPVMKAPADAKVNAEHIKAFKEAIQKGTEWSKKLADALSKGQSTYK